MRCNKCGHQNELGAQICIGCGVPLTGQEQIQIDDLPPAPDMPMQPGRGGLILTLGILSLTCFGPILGIPAWIMGHQDLKKINMGVIPFSQRGTTKGGMICGIIGTLFTSIIMIGMLSAVGLSIFSAHSIQANKDAMINDLNNIAAFAYQYKLSSEPVEGIGYSYIGFRLPDDLAANDNARYHADVVSPISIMFTAVSSQNEDNKIVVYLSGDGNLYDWSFSGDFQ